MLFSITFISKITFKHYITAAEQYHSSSLFSFYCSCLWDLDQIQDETLTKNMRGSLVFLDKHMSSTRRDVKHLKVAYTCVVIKQKKTKD